jgi:hypothetical protein
VGTDERHLHELAARQHGVFSRAQALDAGATPRLVSSRLTSGRWILLAPGVYGYPGHADTWRRRLWIASLNAGPSSVVGFEAAGLVQSLGPLPPCGPTLVVERSRRHAPNGVAWHRLDDLDPSHIEVIDGLRVTTVPRTLLDLASVLRRSRYELVVEDAIVRRRASVAEVGHVLGSIRRRGKPGVLLAEQTLDFLGPGEGLTRSELEKLLDEVLELAGLPEPLREHPLPSIQGLRGFVDRCYPEACWIVEGDGRKWHERRRDMARDAERDLEAARCGYQTTRQMWEHLSSDPHGSARALADVYHQRLALVQRR